jgi:hypothetical protein
VTPKILLLFGFKALFAFLFLPILDCWTVLKDIKKRRKKRMKFKTGLFDMDGTLIDSSKAILSSAKEAARITGLKIPTDKEIKEIIHLPSYLSFKVLYHSSSPVLNLFTQLKSYFSDLPASPQMFDVLSLLIYLFTASILSSSSISITHH